MWEIFSGINKSFDYAKKGLEGALTFLANTTNPSTVTVATDTEKQSKVKSIDKINLEKDNSSTSSDPKHTQRSISNSSSASSSQNKLSPRISNNSTQKPSHHLDGRYGRQASSGRRANSMPHSNVPSRTPSAIGAHSPSLQNTYQRANPHPAGLKPVNSLSQQNQPQTTLTGRGARDAVLRRGIRPTNFKSDDAIKAKERDLENIGIRLAGLEFELSRTEIRKGNLNTVKYHPEFGSYNSRRMEGYRDKGSNIKKDIKTLNESLLKFYTEEERAKVDAARINELQKLKQTPSLSPSAPLVATQPSLGHLTMR